MGSFRATIPRNDRLVNSHEPHIVVGNLGNVDWQPCLNLWAVVEYVTKYATKSPEGMKSMKDVLKDAVSQVCKYSRDGEPTDYFRKALQKFYAKSVGDRDYSLFEAMRLGLNLPSVVPLMPVVSLNTLGARRFKTPGEMVRETGDSALVAWESKVDKFDRRLELVRRQCKKDAVKMARLEKEVQHLSLYEFFLEVLLQQESRR
jgi:hypothetical protein